jgi:hypothetical protein
MYSSITSKYVPKAWPTPGKLHIPLLMILARSLSNYSLAYPKWQTFDSYFEQRLGQRSKLVNSMPCGALPNTRETRLDVRY